LQSDLRFFLFFIFLRSLTILQTDAGFWKNIFSDLLKKQPDVCDRTGTLLRLLPAFSLVLFRSLISGCSLPCPVPGLVSFPANPAANVFETFDAFWGLVRQLAVQKPSTNPEFSLAEAHALAHDDVRIRTVEELYNVGKNAAGNSSWAPPQPRGAPAARAPVPSQAPAVHADPMSRMQVFYGPWTHIFSNPIKAEWPTPRMPPSRQ
jgi:hypothetical protein